LQKGQTLVASILLGCPYTSSINHRWWPRYEELVAEAAARVETETFSDLPAMVDRLGQAAGAAFWALAIGGGSAWKLEVALGRFFKENLANQIHLDVRVLLAGLTADDASVGP